MTHRSTPQRRALLVSGGLTAFVLVVVGAVAQRVNQEAARPTAAPRPVVRATLPPSPAVDPAVQALLDQREAAYQELLKAANDRLADANARLSQAYAQAPAAVQPAPAARPATMTPEQATQIALAGAAGATLLQPPDLVNFQGLAAYEVVLDQGTVYVDAVSGQVLYNGASLAMAAGGGGGGEREGDEHASREHDEGGGDD